MTTKSLKAKRKSPKYMPPPESLANLIPYPKGVSGNAGSGNGYSLTSALKNKLGKPLKEPPVDAPVRDHIVYKTLKGATELVPVAFRETWDRSDGKLVDKESGNTYNDIKVMIVRERPKELTQPVVDDSTE